MLIAFSVFRLFTCNSMVITDLNFSWNHISNFRCKHVFSAWLRTGFRIQTTYFFVFFLLVGNQQKNSLQEVSQKYENVELILLGFNVKFSSTFLCLRLILESEACWFIVSLHSFYLSNFSLANKLSSIFNSRNNEKRKEKSRDAARCRRSRETEIFTELATSLPLKAEDIEHLDKASVMRLSISYLKVNSMLELCKYNRRQSVWKIWSESLHLVRYGFSRRFDLFLVPKLKNSDVPAEADDSADDDEAKDVKPQILSKYIEEEKFTLMALDGFLLVLNDDGDITYVSENISEVLGLAMVRRTDEVFAIVFYIKQISSRLTWWVNPFGITPTLATTTSFAKLWTVGRLHHRKSWVDQNLLISILWCIATWCYDWSARWQRAADSSTSKALLTKSVENNEDFKTVLLIIWTFPGGSLDGTRCVQWGWKPPIGGNWQAIGASIKHRGSVRIEHLPDQAHAGHEVQLHWQPQVSL